MSLLNEMLKDLDKNKGTDRPAALLVQPSNRRFVKQLPNTLTWLTVFVMLSVFTIILMKQTKSTLNAAVTATAAIAPLISTIAPSPTFKAQTTDTIETAVEPEPADPFYVHEEENPATTKVWFDEHLNEALEAIQDGEDPRAIDLLASLLTVFPKSIEARESLAAIYLSHAELGKADDVIEEGLAFEPYNLRLIMMKARLLVEQGQHQKALTLLEPFNPDINKTPDYYGLLAAIFEGLGRTSDAGSLYQSLIRVDPSNGQYWLGFGIALEHKNARNQAIEAYTRASQSENAQPAVRSYAENRLKNLQG